jgi:GMP synthase (glutamine-hydrolysing)
MNILCISHADFETPGIIEEWANQSGYNFTICKPYDGENCLVHANFDFLIIMGGPQSPTKIEKYPYLQDEITLIKQAVQSHKIVLGICLGAQLIGEALGGTTTRSPEKEVGVFPITLTEEGIRDPLFTGFSLNFPVIHWHNDMPGETANSVILAYSEGCPRQIVRYDTLVYGFQCHLEITRAGIKTMLDACPTDLAPSRFTQKLPDFLQQDYESINQTMAEILNRLINIR